jgi:hypothetical protein
MTPVEKIGAAPHLRRNLWLLFALACAAVVIGADYVLLQRHDAFEIRHLEQFKAAYTQKCDAPEFAEPIHPLVRKLYLSSSKLQTAIGRERSALDGGASCEMVARALRAAEFPMVVVGR